MYICCKIDYLNSILIKTDPIRSINTRSYSIYLIYVLDEKIYLLSAIDMSNVTIDFVYSYYPYLLSSYSYPIFLISIMISFNKTMLSIYIDVFSLNYRAISLYMWCGYTLSMQRSEHVFRSLGYSLAFENTKSQSKNFWRRYIIIKDW